MKERFGWTESGNYWFTFQGKTYTFDDGCDLEPEYRSHTAEGLQLISPDNWASVQCHDNSGAEFTAWWFLDDSDIPLDEVDLNDIPDDLEPVQD